MQVAWRYRVARVAFGLMLLCVLAVFIYPYVFGPGIQVRTKRFAANPISAHSAGAPGEAQTIPCASGALVEAALPVSVLRMTCLWLC